MLHFLKNRRQKFACQKAVLLSNSELLTNSFFNKIGFKYFNLQATINNQLKMDTITYSPCRLCMASWNQKMETSYTGF